MVEPTGYTALDLIGFTDRGNYNPVTNYVKNDLVHYGGSIWRILIDDTMGQTPQEGLYYTVFVKEPTNMVERIMAPLEQNPATQAWTVGRQIINNDYLYEVIAPIAIGDNLVAYEDDPTNANIKLAPPIETQVLAIKNEADKTEDMIAPAESNPAAASHSVGTQIIVDNILYDVTSPIAASDALVAYPTTGYNIKPAAPVSSQIQALTNDKVNVSDVVNNLTTTTSGKVLDARQGKVLADKDQNTRDSLAPTEDDTKYSKSYTKGEQFYRNGVLYEVTASSVNTSTTINTGSGGNAKTSPIVTTSIKRLSEILVMMHYTGTTSANGNLSILTTSQAKRYKIFLATCKNSSTTTPYVAIPYVYGSGYNLDTAVGISVTSDTSSRTAITNTAVEGYIFMIDTQYLNVETLS